MNQEKKNHKHLKPLYWGIFSGGGTIAALALASIVFIICILLPLGILGDANKFYANLHGFVANKFVFLVLAGIIFTLLWHGVHRFYYILHDMHIHVGNRVRLGFYAFTISAFFITLCAGWF